MGLGTLGPGTLGQEAVAGHTPAWRPCNSFNCRVPYLQGETLLPRCPRYLYLPRGRPWPEPHDACLAPGAGAGAGAGEQQQGAGGGGVTAMAVLLRRNIHASSVEPKVGRFLEGFNPGKQPDASAKTSLQVLESAQTALIVRGAPKWRVRVVP